MHVSSRIVVAQIMGKMNGGGVESVIMNYYRNLDRSRFQFDFICDADSTEIPYEEIRALGGNVILCPPYQKLPQYIRFLVRLFKEKNYQIVHANINTLCVFPLFAAKRAGIPVRIAHSHTTSSPREWKKNLAKDLLRLFSRCFATDFFACTKHAGTYQFGSAAVRKGSVLIIPNAIPIESFQFDPEARTGLREDFGFKESDYVIGHVGRFIPQKNHTQLLDIFREIKKNKSEAKLLLIGKGPLQEHIKQKAQSMNLDRDIIFAGQRNDVNKCYSAMDLFLFPSLYEGLGMVVVEAQVNGLHCVVSTNVPKDADVGNTEFSDSADSYVKAAVSMAKRASVSCPQFDIRLKSKELQQAYEAALAKSPHGVG